MARFIAVYDGPSIAEAQLVAVSSDPNIIRALEARFENDRTSGQRIIKSGEPKLIERKTRTRNQLGRRS